MLCVHTHLNGCLSQDAPRHRNLSKCAGLDPPTPHPTPHALHPRLLLHQPCSTRTRCPVKTTWAQAHVKEGAMIDASAGGKREAFGESMEGGGSLILLKPVDKYRLRCVLRRRSPRCFIRRFVSLCFGAAGSDWVSPGSEGNASPASPSPSARPW